MTQEPQGGAGHPGVTQSAAPGRFLPRGEALAPARRRLGPTRSARRRLGGVGCQGRNFLPSFEIIFAYRN